MNKTIETRANSAIPTQKLMSLLSEKRDFNSPEDKKDYTITWEISGISPWYINHCHQRMLILKEVKRPKDNPNDPGVIINSRKYYCVKCGIDFYDDFEE